MRRSLPALAALTGAALLAAGCGGSKSSTSSVAEKGSVPESASLAPGDATAFVTIDTDSASEGWANVDRLVALVPGARKALDGSLASSLSEDGLTWKKDVRPALGKELVIVVTHDNKPILLLQPGDQAAFERLAHSGTDRPVLAEIEGWQAAADTQADLDAYRKALSTGTIEKSDGSAPRWRASPATRSPAATSTART